MTAKQLIKLLEKNGWKLKNQRGSHKNYIHPTTKGKVTIPYHGNKDINIKTLNNILKQAGLK